MKGHKEADCREKQKDNKAAPAADANKITCGWCKKVGHKETDCYAKKKGTPKATPAAKASSKRNEHKVKRGYCFGHLCTIMNSNDK